MPDPQAQPEIGAPEITLFLDPSTPFLGLFTIDLEASVRPPGATKLAPRRFTPGSSNAIRLGSALITFTWSRKILRTGTDCFFEIT